MMHPPDFFSFPFFGRMPTLRTTISSCVKASSTPIFSYNDAQIIHQSRVLSLERVCVCVCVRWGEERRTFADVST